MSNPPNFGLRKKPQFSANHLAEYLCSVNAKQREAVIRAAKFPRKTAVIAYRQAKPPMRSFLTAGDGDLAYFDTVLARFEATKRRSADYDKMEAQRCIDAIEAFKTTFSRGRAKRYSFDAGPIDVSMVKEGVKINVRLDVTATERNNEGGLFSGGAVFFMSASAGSRKNIEERRKHTASLVHWVLEESSQSIEPLPRLCMSIDVFGGEIVKAPSSYDRLRANIVSSCQEVALKWDMVAPPASYDGPEWR